MPKVPASAPAASAEHSTANTPAPSDSIPPHGAARPCAFATKEEGKLHDTLNMVDAICQCSTDGIAAMLAAALQTFKADPLGSVHAVRQLLILARTLVLQLQDDVHDNAITRGAGYTDEGAEAFLMKVWEATERRCSSRLAVERLARVSAPCAPGEPT